MAKKKILLIEDDRKTENAVREALGGDYSVETARDEKAASALLEETLPDLMIIDFDLKGKDGLQIFKEIQASVRVIMLSASGSVPLAVSATKLGVADFLRKPINAEQLRVAVEKNIMLEETSLRWIEGLEWLQGGGVGLRKMYSDIQATIAGGSDVLLIGERGIAKEKVAEFIHRNSAQRRRRFIKLDMASFRRESLEPHFWAAVQEFMALPEGKSLQSEEDRSGMLYLENVEHLDEHFKQAVFSFFRERRGKIDRKVRVVFGFYQKSAVPKYVFRGHAGTRDHALIEIPPLRARKEDLPRLLELYLNKYSVKLNKKVSFISTEVLEFLANYEYPGNYLELERMIQEAVLNAPEEKLELKNIPVHFKGLLQVSMRESLRENLPLEEARRRFEKDLYHIMLKKAGGESAKVARFLDVPKSVLAERLEDLID